MRRLLPLKYSVFIWAVFILLGVVFTIGEYNNRLPKPGYRLVEGRVVKVEVKKTSLSGYPYGDSYETFLTIKIVNTDTVVTARLAGNRTNTIPDIVTFYYSGDPTEMVFLLEDTSWLKGGVLFLIMAATMILGSILVAMLQKRDERYRYAEQRALLEKIKRS